MIPSKIDDKLHWYKDAIIYELHIKAFKDANGDGIGDFEGLMQQLDYLQWLGVTAIWVLPFYPSPLRDDGYDIADYYSINPSYGNLEDFQRFLEEAHKRDLKVITELVINHTSDQHPWFQRARRAPKGSPEREFYVWSDDPNKYKDVRIIFQDFEASNWTWDPVAQQYYWHRFFHHQPDLNYDNPQVQEEIFKILDYWCDMGVDGFRLDAVPYLYEREGTNGENLPETHAFLKKLRRHMDEKYPGTLFLAEANMWPEDSAAYFGDGDECHMNYHFPLMPRMFMSLQMEDRYPIIDILDQTPPIPDTCQWGIFLRNHDELTLEMVTDEERVFMYKVYVKNQRARINLGIRHRLAPLMENNMARIELMNVLLFSLPGTPVIYYGDEIGMGDNYYLGDRDGVRTPMQWSGERNAGFSGANPQQLYLPVIIDPQYHYEFVNVEQQLRNTSSLLWWMKRVIQARKNSKVFGRGDMKIVAVENPKIFAFTRSYEAETLLVVINLSRYAQPAELDLSAYGNYQPVELFSQNKFPAVKADQSYLLTMAPYGYQWFFLEKPQAENHDYEEGPALEIQSWKGLLDKYELHLLLHRILPPYLKKARWFGGKARTLESLQILNQEILPTEGKPTILLLLEANYTSGLSEWYQLPLAFAAGEQAVKKLEGYPQSIICRLKTQEEEGVLYDALFGESLQQFIIQKMAHSARLSQQGNELVFSGSEALQHYVSQADKITPRILGAEQSNTSVVYDKNFFLKIYRKVDKAINPDVEITRFLTEQTGFNCVPTFAGTIAWKQGRESIALAMMQTFVENSIDGWSYVLERIRVFQEGVLSGAAVSVSTTASELPVINEAELRSLLEGVPVAERTALLGKTTAQMHLALASDKEHPDFKPEPFSLHYQRSLFSSFQTLVRVTFQNLSRNLPRLPENIRQEAMQLLPLRENILNTLKRIYARKLDAYKIRIHGDYHLGQVLFTGKDVVVLDFEGEPARSFSERRLKRSPLRDVAGMMRSYHYAALGSLFLNAEISEENKMQLMPYMDIWYRQMSELFLQQYLEALGDSPLVPHNNTDLAMMLHTYTLEKAIYELNYELNNRPDWVMIPLRGILSLMEEIKHTD